MPNEVFHVRADMVDEEFWIETSATRAATVQLHATLELARMREVWMPRFCLMGPEGSGKTALAKRVMRQAQRNVACRMGGAAVARGNHPEPAGGGAAAEAMRLAREVADGFGHCPAICSPMRYQPMDLREMLVRPSGDWYNGLFKYGMPSPGDLAHDPLRRTSLVLIDEADHLLNVGEAKQRLILAEFDEWSRDRYTLVFIGGPALAAALARHGKTQLIPLPALPCGAEFAEIVGMVFGTRDPGDVARIHRASGGCMGPLMHMAALDGLEPPFGVSEREVARLPQVR